MFKMNGGGPTPEPERVSAYTCGFNLHMASDGEYLSIAKVSEMKDHSAADSLTLGVKCEATHT